MINVLSISLYSLHHPGRVEGVLTPSILRAEGMQDACVRGVLLHQGLKGLVHGSGIVGWNSVVILMGKGGHFPRARLCVSPKFPYHVRICMLQHWGIVEARPVVMVNRLHPCLRFI